MALLSYDKVSVEKDSKGGEKLTLHFTSFRPSGNPLDDQDTHQFTMTPNEWFKIRNSVNKLLGES